MFISPLSNLLAYLLIAYRPAVGNMSVEAKSKSQQRVSTVGVIKKSVFACENLFGWFY